MKNVILLVILCFVLQDTKTQCPTPGTIAQPGFDVKCGKSLTRAVDLGTVTFIADGSGQNLGPVREKQAIQKKTANFFKRFPFFALGFFNCDNRACQTVDCIKSVEVKCAWGTDPRHVQGSGPYHGISSWTTKMRLKIKATCSDCDDGDPAPPVQEPGTGKVEVECDSEQGYAFPFLKLTLDAETEDGAAKEAEEAQKVIDEFLKIFPNTLDVTVNCIGECEPNEVCEGSFEYGSVEVLGPSFDGEKYSVQYIVRGTAYCTSCQIEDKEPQIGTDRRGATAKQGFKYYPNPATNHIHVELGTLNMATATSLEIIDILGRSVYAKDISAEKSNYTINVHSIPNGLYYLRIKDDAGILEQVSLVIEK